MVRLLSGLRKAGLIFLGLVFVFFLFFLGGLVLITTALVQAMGAKPNLQFWSDVRIAAEMAVPLAAFGLLVLYARKFEDDMDRKDAQSRRRSRRRSSY